jgi:acyl-CoA synthetase (AMP-forming)/AMP-acid ligase II
MNIMTLLELAATGTPDRVAVGRLRQAGSEPDGLTYAELLDRARIGAAVLAEHRAAEVVYLGVNGSAFPMALFASACAGVPLIPINYRLGEHQLAVLLEHHPHALVISDSQPPTSAHVVSTWQWRALCALSRPDVPRWIDEPEAVAVLLYTSGTTSAPKAAVLRHRHLVSYLLGSVDFGTAGEHDAMLVSVPPYHIAGVSNLLSNLYAGRRIVYLESFTPEAWLDCIRTEEISHALLVPTMLARLAEHLATLPPGALPSRGMPPDPHGPDPDGPDAGTPTLRSLAYGGARTPAPVLDRVMRLFPSVDFVNAYGLTETSSTVAVLGPDDHRAALAGDPVARARLGSVGRPLPGIEVQVRADDGTSLPAGAPGDIYVRGPQVSGEYRDAGSQLDADGWLGTRDRGWVDKDGYLFIEGRADDTIIRGGENIAPAEIEEVLLEHGSVAEAAVVGIPDEHWGQDIAAAIVLRPGRSAAADELREWVRARLRGSRTPALIVFRDALPCTPTGKLLRREVLADLRQARAMQAGWVL